MYLFSRYFLSDFIEEFWCHKSWCANGGSPHPQGEPGRHLTDAVVGNFDPNITSLSDSQGATVVSRGKVPYQDVWRFDVKMDDLVLVEVFQTLRNL